METNEVLCISYHEGAYQAISLLSVKYVYFISEVITYFSCWEVRKSCQLVHLENNDEITCICFLKIWKARVFKRVGNTQMLDNVYGVWLEFKSRPGSKSLIMEDDLVNEL